MNREELNKLISNYESKWGKLGHTNIMRPELNHSGINNKEEKQMSNMTNDLIKFRQKAFEGKRKNSLAHKATLDITEMNELNYEQLLESRTLIHAANYKYYQKIELPSGETRYFYTKEEWDAYQNTKSTRQEAMKKAQKKQHQLNTAQDLANNAAGAVSNALNAASTLKARQEAKKNMNLLDERWKNMQGDTVKQYAQIARESTPAAAAKAFMEEAAVTEFLDVVEDGFKSGKLKYENGYLVADDEGIGNNLDSTSANIQKWANWIGKESGNGRKIQDELEKLIGDDIEKLYNKYNRKTESQGQKLVQHDAFVDSEELMDEYSVFMEKVKRGKERNRLAHSTVISPAELNARYEEELTSHGILIHAGGYGPASGTNAYVAKIDNFYGQGKPRYFYTKEEWDAYQRNAKGAQNAGKDKANTNNAAQIEKQKKSIAENQRKNAEAAANAGARNAGTITKSKNEENYLWEASAKARDNGNNALFDKVHAMYDEALYEASGEKPVYVLQSNGTKYKDHMQRSRLNGKANDDPEFNNKVVEIWKKKLSKDDWDALEKLQKNPYGKQGSDNQTGSAKQGEAEGKGYEEYQKQQKEKLAKERAEISRKNDAGRDAAMKAGQKSEQDRQKLEEAKKNVNKEIDELHNNANDNVYDATDLSNALKRNLNQDKIDDIGSELGGILTEYYKVVDNNDDSDEGSKLKRKAWDEYFEKRDKIFEKYGIKFNSKEYFDALKVSEEIEKEYEKKHKYDTSADAKIKKNIKEREYNKNNGSAKHSTLDELNDFRARVALGKEKNRLAHSRLISLDENNSLKHATNTKYYQKIDKYYKDGTARYFWSKDEWDAYQREKNAKQAQGAQKAQAAQGQANSYTVKKAQEESQRKNAEAAKAQGREKQSQSYTVKKKLENNIRKNADYIKNAEKDRWLKTIDNILKKEDAPLKDVDNKPPIEPVAPEVEVKPETPKNNTEKANYISEKVNEVANAEVVHNYAWLVAYQSLYGPDALTSEGQQVYYDAMNNINAYIDSVWAESNTLYGDGSGDEIFNAINNKVQELINLYYDQLYAEWAAQEAQRQQDLINLQNQQMMWNMMGF